VRNFAQLCAQIEGDRSGVIMGHQPLHGAYCRSDLRVGVAIVLRSLSDRNRQVVRIQKCAISLRTGLRTAHRIFDKKNWPLGLKPLLARV